MRTVLNDEAVTVPEVYHEDVKERVLIIADCGTDSIDLKSAVLAGRVSVASAIDIGERLGCFLANLHMRGREKDVMARFAGNTDALRVSTWVTYGRLVDVLTGPRIQPPLALSETQLDIARDIVRRRSTEMAEAPETLTMGDLWPGKNFETPSFHRSRS